MAKNPSAEIQSAFLVFQVRILDENFDTYEIPHFSWLPKIETVLVDNPEMPP
jgi:CO/xanthine dehydrogenase Mo-binding subunit